MIGLEAGQRAKDPNIAAKPRRLERADQDLFIEPRPADEESAGLRGSERVGELFVTPRGQIIRFEWQRDTCESGWHG